MRRSRGRRFDDEPKLNVKKVVATIVAVIVIVMVVASIILTLNKKNKEKLLAEKNIEYFSAYSNSKWSVINSKGEQLSNISYDDMIVVPDQSKNIFIVSYDVDYQNGVYKTKAINEKNETLFGNYNNINAIVNYNSIDEVWYNQDVLTFERDGKYGLIDFNGNQVLAPEYDEIYSLKGILKTLIINKDGKYGIFNTSSKSVAVSPLYVSIQAFGATYNDGYIVEDENKKFGLIGSDGKVVLQNNYDDIFKVVSSDKYVVKDGLKTKLIDKEGTTILESGFDEIVSINGDNIVIKKANRYGIINTAGEVIIDTAYDSVKYCFSDYYIVSTGGKYGVINTLKDVLIDIKYEGIDYRSDIVSLICENADYTTDIYTRDLKYVLTGTINKVDTELGYIRVREGIDYKYYNLQYQEISNVEALKNNTLFLVKENGKYGYVNKENKKIVDCIYDDAIEQNKFGFCAVKKDGKWGCLQSNGAVILEPTVSLENNIYIDFIGTWHLTQNIELNTYTK
ncbi:MAG: WG repeat-containing protein [Clostridia bacterium]|nr:WG repeat-containing protein [Clostridia bacterium]